MENIKQYIGRKYQELVLFNEYLASPLMLRPPNSIADIVNCKFRLAAALKAEHALNDWALTETAWARAPVFRSGPFQFAFNYQRADLQVSGPPIYPDLAASGRVVDRGIYTCSAMAALSAILLAVRKISNGVDVLASGGCYSETLELIENFRAGIRVIRGSGKSRTSQSRRAKILLVDSSVTDGSSELLTSDDPQRFKLVLMDATCFWTGSGRIKRLVNRFIDIGLPVLLVRSHTKLDSLGIEYGRLGSIVLAVPKIGESRRRLRWLEQLLKTIPDAVRLTGAAAIPAHFPPFVGSERYADLGARRVAAIQSNSRRLSRWLRENVCEPEQILTFPHALFIAFASKSRLDIEGARGAAGDLCDELSRAGLPARRAGSFGFDFITAEWSFVPPLNRTVVRLSVADLPWPLLERGLPKIERWPFCQLR